MKDIRKRLERELNQTAARLRRMGGAVMLEELPGTPGDNSPFADEVDSLKLSEDREMSFATRSILLERANKLAEALKRLDDGEYGLCQECGEQIAPARLRAVPEVTTCVRCQDRIERMANRLQAVGPGFAGEETDEE